MTGEHDMKMPTDPYEESENKKKFEPLRTNESDNDIGRHLSVLIDIFYGLAIGEGISQSIPKLIEKPDIGQGVFLLVAFVMGIGEWFAYHIFIAPKPYRDIPRLILDILFPVTIFCLFVAAEHSSLESVILSIYFILSFIYAILLERESSEIPKWLRPTVIVSFVFSAGAFITSIYSQRYSTIIAEIVSMLVGAHWGIRNLMEARSRLIDHTNKPLNISNS